METNTDKKNGGNNGGKLPFQEIIIHDGRNVKKRIAHPQKYTLVCHDERKVKKRNWRNGRNEIQI